MIKKIKIKKNRDLNESEEGLDLIIRSKLDQIQDLEKKIQYLQKILKALQKTYGSKVKTTVREPSMKELLQFCSAISNAVKGKAS